MDLRLGAAREAELAPLRGARVVLAAVLVLAAVACGGERVAVGAAGGGGEEVAAAAVADASAAAAAPAVVAAESALLITVDTLRADALGFAGNERVATPVLDRLAAGGRFYPRAHAHNVVTLPSHANLLTGLLPFQHGVRDNSGFVLPKGVPTAASVLAEAGFATAAFVGAFPLDARFGLARGFDLYDDGYPEGSRGTGLALAERRGDAVVAPAVRWWNEHRGERRFAWVHLFDPHAPYAPAEPYASRYRDAPYLGEVAAVDAYLEPLLAPLLDGRDAPALVIFTSDHGESLGAHGERTHGLFAYEETLRVPLVVWAPGLPAGSSDEPARHIDVLPTLLAALGIEAPPGLPGRSLLAAPAAGNVGAETYFEALTANLNQGWAPLRGVIHGGLKLVSLPLPELYDLARDPGEADNLFDRERRRARELAERLPAESVWPPERGRVPAEVARALESLGYLSGPAARRDAYTPADDPKNLVELDQMTHRILDLYAERRLGEAAAVAREVVRRRPDMGVAYYHLAQVLLEAGEVGEALSVMSAAVARNVAGDRLLRQMGLTLAELGRASEAVELLAPRAAAEDPDLLNALGVVLSEAGRQEEARATLERVFAHDPRNPEAHQHLALVALRGRRWAEARRQAESALALNRELPLAWNYLGVARYNLGRAAESLDAWEEALRLAPGDYDLLYNLAVVAVELGEAGRARGALERFLREAPPERYGAERGKARAMLQRIGGS